MMHYFLTVIPSYWGLDHLHALPPHLGDNGRDVHHILLGSLLQSCVNGNQCASPPNTSTAGRQLPSHHKQRVVKCVCM